jgi:hypothetical protein
LAGSTIEMNASWRKHPLCVVALGLLVLGIWDETWFMPGPVSNPHAAIERQCVLCHPGFSGTPNRGCMACKTRMKFVEDAGIHLHGEEKRCAACHVEHRTRIYPLALSWVDEERFDHKWTGFDLGRYHKGLKCSKCHLETRPYRDVARTCDGCHADFAPGAWMHDKTGCKLDSLHSGLACAECHTERWGEGKTPSCITCHPQADYRPRQACPSDQPA